MNLGKKDILIFIILFFLIYKTCFVSEKMANVSQTDVENAVKNVYQTDVEAIRNLSNLATDLTKNGKLIIKGGLEIEGPLKVSTEINCEGPLKVNNDIKCEGDGYFGPAFIGASIKADGSAGLGGPIKDDVTKYAQFSHVNCKDDQKYGFRQSNNSTIYLNSDANITLWENNTQNENKMVGYLDTSQKKWTIWDLR